ncbi:hypothetical protein I3842_14G068000 [Carya illinoinensis]|uniref:Uncharacterized protein n=1 Tax=Carya illinoinensis TaxID=32201 RepID=A0A922AAS0_CARIL|nr:hypothetical protein I3842_14G068000 [Carya illinoinensis]
MIIMLAPLPLVASAWRTMKMKKKMQNTTLNPQSMYRSWLLTGTRKPQGSIQEQFSLFLRSMFWQAVSILVLHKAEMLPMAMIKHGVRLFQRRI